MMIAYGTSIVSRADLIRLYDHFGLENLDHICAFSGYRRIPKTKLEVPAIGAISPETPSTGSHEIEKKQDYEISVPFCRVVSSKTFAKKASSDQLPEAFRKAIILEEKDLRADPSRNSPSKLPLCPWSRMWPFLRDALGAVLNQRALDIPEIIRLSARLRPMQRLPRVTRRGWARRALIIADLDNRLVPFWQDMRRLYDDLVKIRGEVGLEPVLFDRDPFGRVYTLGKHGPIPKHFKLPEPGTPILILSDLGLFDRTENMTESWLLFGKKLCHAGLAPVVLTPAPRRLWTDELTRVFRMACWDRGQRLPKLYGSSSSGSKPIPSVEKREGIDRLMALLSVAIRVEPELLRALRLLLPNDQTDAGDEAAVWHHEHVHRGYGGIGIDPQSVHSLREDFTALSDDLKKRVCEMIQIYHRHLSPAVFYEEGLLAGRCGVMLKETEEAEKYFWNCFKSYTQSDFSEKTGYEAFIRRLAYRHEDDASMWAYDVMCAAHVQVNGTNWTRGKIVLTKGFDPARVAWMWPQEDTAKNYALLQQGPYLIARRPAQSESAGSPVADLTSSNGVLHVQALNSQTETESYATNLKSPTPVPIDIPEEGRLRLGTTHHEVILENSTKPSWAQGWGRDGEGLYLILPQRDQTRKAYWLAPGDYPVGRQADGRDSNLYSVSVPSSSGHLEIDIKKGFWWDEREFRQFLENGFQMPEWSHPFGFGTDAYGIYAEFAYAGVVQRMRWIMPGEFLMGSPETEPERWDDEQQHKVVLTQGYWLAETACTQALWQTVMGDNPSRFKGKDRPVENVSWNDCQNFIAGLNAKIPGLGLCLPTEAQWEYACRAGTTTPFHFGETIATDKVNFDGNFPYTNGPKGEYRQQTVPVKSLPCNAWGLYEMHGNVLEWCADWFGPYPENSAVDPTGPNQGESRVLRGGSWISDGGRVRSARRGRGAPALRSDGAGLRLARGQTRPASSGSGGAGQSKSTIILKKGKPAGKGGRRKTSIFDRLRKK